MIEGKSLLLVCVLGVGFVVIGIHLGLDEDMDPRMEIEEIKTENNDEESMKIERKEELISQESMEESENQRVNLWMGVPFLALLAVCIIGYVLVSIRKDEV